MIAGAGSDRHFLESTDSSAPMPTKVYTLSSGESTESVAKKYNIPLSALRQLNQLRTFSHGFDHLQPGDELDVPYAPLSTITWDKQHSRAADASGTLNDDVQGVLRRNPRFFRLPKLYRGFILRLGNKF
ncbi:LysM peptidoglycan-binding domain-containing protein, partial [Erwinia persicina]